MVRREYKVPLESFEKALTEMIFHRAKATPKTVHYRRGDGLHVVLSRATRKGRSRTVVKVHKDDLPTHRVVKLEASERGRFLPELTSRAGRIEKWERNG